MIFNFRVSRQNIQEMRAARRRKARGTRHELEIEKSYSRLRLVTHAISTPRADNFDRRISPHSALCLWTGSAPRKFV